MTASPPVRAEPHGSECCVAEHQSSVYPRRFHHSGIKTVTAARSLAFGALLLLGAGHRIRGSIHGHRTAFQELGLERRVLQPLLRLCRVSDRRRGAFIVGGAHGTGRVYVGGIYTGDSTVTQVSLGFQAGGKAYSEIVFFEDKRSLDEFESGSFEFDAAQAPSQ